jgi:hypothetical protein
VEQDSADSSLMGYGPDIGSRQFHNVHWMNIDRHCFSPLHFRTRQCSKFANCTKGRI